MSRLSKVRTERGTYVRFTKLQVMQILAQYADTIEDESGLHLTNLVLPVHFVLYDFARMFSLSESEIRAVLGDVAYREIAAYANSTFVLSDSNERNKRPFPLPVPYDVLEAGKAIARCMISVMGRLT